MKLLRIFTRSLSGASRQQLSRNGVLTFDEGHEQLPVRGEDLSSDAVRMLATEAANADPSVVEKVAAFYSLLPNITKFLPATTIATVLTYLLRDTKRDVPAAAALA